MKKRTTSLLLASYIVALCAFIWAGYYFYADYSIRHTERERLLQNERFQSDLAYVDLPRISLTMQPDGNEHSGNVRMDITLEVENKYAQKVSNNRPRITDRLIHYTESLTFKELSQSKSTSFLRPEFLAVINEASSPAPVRNVIFREFITL